MHPEAGTITWLSKVQEETIDPERSIICLLYTSDAADE